MSDFKSVKQLCEENSNLDLHIRKLDKTITELEHKNKELENSLIELKKYYESLDKFATTVYAPNKPTYKELEDKLALAENSKQTAIDDVYETEIIPLKNEVKDKNIQLDLSYSKIKQLQKIIKNLNTRIDFAVGYISATQPHTDKSPSEVKKWLFEGGFKENL